MVLKQLHSFSKITQTTPVTKSIDVFVLQELSEILLTQLWNAQIVGQIVRSALVRLIALRPLKATTLSKQLVKLTLRVWLASFCYIATTTNVIMKRKQSNTVLSIILKYRSAQPRWLIASHVVTIKHALNVRPEPILILTLESVSHVSTAAAHAQDLTNVLLAHRDIGFKETLARNAWMAVWLVMLTIQRVSNH